MISGKTILLTGATDGIGKQTAFELARKGATLIMHGKNDIKGNKIRSEIITETGNKKIYYFNADFTSFADIKNMVNSIKNQFQSIDVLINNAGIYENNKLILDSGIEKTFMVNHLAPFALTMQLLGLLRSARNARIIVVSSMIHASRIDFDNLNGEKFFSGDYAYSLSKLCNILFTNELSHRIQKDGITVVAVHPGVINTKLLRAGWSGFGASPSDGAKRLVYLAESKQVEGITGKYFENDMVVPSASVTTDKTVSGRLWSVSYEYLRGVKE